MHLQLSKEELVEIRHFQIKYNISDDEHSQVSEHSTDSLVANENVTFT